MCDVVQCIALVFDRFGPYRTYGSTLVLDVSCWSRRRAGVSACYTLRLLNSNSKAVLPHPIDSAAFMVFSGHGRQTIDNATRGVK